MIAFDDDRHLENGVAAFRNDERDADTGDQLFFGQEDSIDLKQDARDALAHIRKESHDIYNRLHSIQEDVGFVNGVAEHYSALPLLPNLRCGAWYTDPKIATSVPAYFKSTDGHFSNWSFNLRRPNLHLLPLIKERRGVMLVDSTRSGKKIPDALSKTVPIWCAVVNRAIALRYPRTTDMRWNEVLYTPPATVSAQEHSQIASNLDRWASSLANSSYDIPNLDSPLRPLWITPSTSNFPDINGSPYLPVICVSASRQIAEGMERRSAGYSYIQGSADDHEAWGMGLTPDIFWRYHATLLSTAREALPETVASLTSTSGSHSASSPSVLWKTRGRIILCANSDLAATPADCAHLVITTNQDDLALSSKPHLVIRTMEGKKGQRQFLADVLPRSSRFLKEWLAKGMTMCVSCSTGNDIGAGVVLVALQLFFDDEGRYDDDAARPADKRTLRTRLEWIISDRPSANPSRTTLKRINQFLLTPTVFV